MQTNAHYVEYGGQRWVSRFSGDDWVAIAATPEQFRTGRFPDSLGTGEDRAGFWVKIPKTSITARFSVLVHVAWQGEECTVARVDGEQALLYYDGLHPVRAKELGMEGSNYMGWSITVPVSELELIKIDERQFA